MRAGEMIMRCLMATVMTAAATALAAPGAAAAADLPAALMHDGRPLDALCFDFFEDHSVAVDACRNPDIVPLDDPQPADLDEYGWYGYTYRLADLPEDAAMRGWVAWRPLGETAAGHVVETLHNGGGTGTFTGVVTVRREGDRLHLVEGHMGGDRCNGGVAAAAVAGGVVAGSQHITPMDLLALALEEEPAFKAYEEIAACAICCVGTATIIGGSLAWVTLDDRGAGGFAASVGDEGDGPQACLDRLIEHSRPTLARPGLDHLAARFRAECGGD